MTQQPPPPPYQPNPYGQPAYGFPPQDHPQAVTVLILGILGLVVCSVISPFAWVKGNHVLAEIDASHGRIGGRSMANAGRICGIIGTCLLALGLLVTIGALLLLVVASVQSASVG